MQVIPLFYERVSFLFSGPDDCFKEIEISQGLEGNMKILYFPLWKRGIKGDFKNKCFYSSIIKSPLPLCQRGVFKGQ